MCGLSKVPNSEIFSNLPSFMESINTIFLSHKVHFIKLCNHAKNKQGTLVKLLSCEKALKMINILQGMSSLPHIGLSGRVYYRYPEPLRSYLVLHHH